MSLYDKMNKTLMSTKKNIIKHSPELLTGIGISSMIISTVLAVKATPKAIKQMENAKKIENNSELSVKEVIKLTWKDYIIPFSFCVTGVSCLISSCVINKKKNLALAAAYALSEDALITYKNKVIETVGESKEKKIKEKVNQEKINNNLPKESQIVITSKGNTLMQDTISGRYFKSDLDTIRKSINELNREMTYQNYISLNQFYNSIGLDSIKNGDDIGWNISDGLLDLDFDTCLAGDEPCICINYNTLPKAEFNMMY